MIFPTLLLLNAVASFTETAAFFAPASTVVGRPRNGSMHMIQQNGEEKDAITAITIGQHERRDFLLQSLGVGSAIASTSFIPFPSIARADDDYNIYKRGGEGGDLTSQLFNPDGSLRDPNSVVSAQENAVDLIISIPTNDSMDKTDGVNIIMSTDAVKPTSTANASANIKASYKLPLKWNTDASSTIPLYYDSSEGKNGKSCNRITVYSITTPTNIPLDMTVLEKASKVGVAKSLFMDQIPNSYFDQGVLKADLISGRTVRKPIQSIDDKGELDEQIYYEFDLAFAPLKCDDFMEGNKENLGLGFCPYDNIFLVSATVVNNSDRGTLMCCVVECNKDEWKMANSDLKRVRSSFILERT